MKKIMLAICLLGMICFAHANKQIDSLQKIINKTSDPEASLDVYVKLARIFTEKESYDSAIVYYFQVLEYSKRLEKPNEQILALKDLGVIYEIKGMYNEAVDYQLQALKLAESTKNLTMQSSVLINLGIVYFNLKNAEQSVAYYNQAIEICKQNNDSLKMLKALNNLGNTYMTLKNDLAQATICFEQVVAVGKQINYPEAVKVGLTNLTQIYANTGQLDKALDVAWQVYDMHKQNPYALYNIGSIYYLKKDYKKALDYMIEAIGYCQSEQELKQILYKDIAGIYQETTQYKLALQYFEAYNNLKDSIHNTEIEKNINELTTKYETEKKEKQILELQLTKKRKDIFIFGLGGIIIFIMIAAMYIIHRTRSKRKIAEKDNKIKAQQIVQMEKEKQLIATNAVLQGEEVERSRIARELHDGLGGLLSGTKLSLNNMKDSIVLSPESVQQFDSALDLLNTSITELRRVAYAMMPEALLKLGLKEALADFCNNLQSTSKETNIVFYYFGDEERIDKKLEISVYRIAQELINNALKYARATDILIQCNKEPQNMQLTVHDNGKGFDISLPENNKGMGLSNIKSRVTAFNGKFQLTSQPGKGTEAIIELPLLN